VTPSLFAVEVFLFFTAFFFSFAFAHSIFVYLVPDLVMTVLFLFFVARNQLSFLVTRKEQEAGGQPLLATTTPKQYEV
jgi:hypothetical protein